MSHHTTLTSGAPRNPLLPRPSRHGHPPQGPRASKGQGPSVTAGQNVSAGVVCALAAFAAMLAVALFGLSLADASSATPVMPAALAIVCLAVGGSAGFSGGSGGGFLSMGMEGGVRGTPLAVTLVGALVLGLAFFWRLRGRRVTAELLFARAAVASVTWLVLLVVAAPLARGSLHLPDSVTAKLKPGAGGSGGGGLLGGGGGGLLGKLGGADRSSSLSAVDFHTDVAMTVFAGLLWLLVVLALGTLAARRPRFPVRFATGRLRTVVGPVLSATATVVLAVTLSLTLVVTVGAFALGGDNGGKAAGAALLVAPNGVFALLSTGLGASWSFSFEGAMDASSPFGSLLSGLSGGLLGGMTGGSDGGSFTPPHRSMSLADVTGGSLAMRLAVLLCALAVLVACGMLTAARTPVATRRDGTPLSTRSTRAAMTAAQVGLAWSVLLVMAQLFGGPSMTGVMSLGDMPLMNLNARGGADSVTAAVLLGLFTAAASGWVGSVVHDTYRVRRSRRTAKASQRPHATTAPAHHSTP